ncbi:Kef-type potassium/proton antiporter, CPA2 family (TC 2.A.37.1) [Hymenobacter roseosalivarius DSM 11622]|uniref:Kef-type potassium/proton antiporter, CPA2 family (TC 2.A.37.1) n=1 Tax=Hymenobacter roseosalivarius DSM 11622 TaxID=645990 RepID=A0A1W1VIM6_9BACT|nr:monovalent cation:proton antiporter-2 (CPA2) family protein [Hymenobacter roseosalivarius]SMB92891.1 Kef-type potassium/proton antiporter, CPA2 family (TC 2.A.37.1) [Hymenobacter roseosalivarius DSM 11622]
MSQSVLLQALVYLAAAVLFVPLAKRFGLGSVLGYLLAGMVIGPAVLGLVGEEGQDVMRVAEFGVVIMLFLVGLELEPALLWKLRTPILGLGGLQVVVTALALAGLAMVAGIEWKPALALGLILAMSSTAIVLQTYKEQNQLGTPAGQGTFSVLLFQDIAVIPILAILPLLAMQPATPGEASAANHNLLASAPGWLRALALVAAVASVVVLGKYGMRPIFRLVARSGLREVFIATALLLVGGVALLMELVGLSPALGAFVAGVVLATSEYKHEIESDIDPFKGLLLGLFFMSVGAAIDFGLIRENPLLVAGAVVAIMLVKTAVLLVLGQRFTGNRAQNATLALGLSQIGEFAFVLLFFTTQNGILDQRITSIATAVVAISMALTPLVFLLNERVIQPRLGPSAAPEREADAIEEKKPVIIAGFGRYGNIVGRFLRANDIGTTVLDFDADRVETLRQLGLRVYYGDASRYDLLHAAGASQAKVIIIALDSSERALELVELVRRHFPHLRILVRAHDRPDAYEFIEAGLTDVYRETVDSSLGVDALRLLGVRAYHAQRAARTFLRHDELAMRELAAVRKDRKTYFSTARQRIQELEQLLHFDAANENLREVDEGWDNESLRQEAPPASSAFTAPQAPVV